MVVVFTRYSGVTTNKTASHNITLSVAYKRMVLNYLEKTADILVDWYSGNQCKLCGEIRKQPSFSKPLTTTVLLCFLQVIQIRWVFYWGRGG
jgi:hypothetical protein